VDSEQPQDELAKTDQLIGATEASLARLKSLRSLIVDYRQCELRAIQDPNDTDNLLKLITLAKQINTIVQDQALQDYYSPQFVEELKKFSQIAEKRNIPQAK
jgi:hypothetical protein